MTTTVKERGILFSAPMVRAILDGRKTQTRRVVKDQRLDGVADVLRRASPRRRGEYEFMWAEPDHEISLKPYAVPGERLWVRETWREHPETGLPEYRANDDFDGVRWRPSIFMPRWASRIMLDVVSVRIERLQDITEADILAEGVTVPIAAELSGIPWSSIPTLHAAWRYGWEAINGVESWGANSWVWRIEFRRTQ